MKKILIIWITLSLCLYATAQEKKLLSFPEFEVEVMGKGPSLFLIPGATCSGDVWQDFATRYGADYTLHMFTLAGYAGVPALSEPPMLSKIEKALIDYINVNKKERVVLAGHSIGGWLGMKIAAENPGLVDRLLIVDALPFLPAANNPAATEEMMRAMSPEMMVQQYQAMDSSAFASMQLQLVKSMVKDSSYHEKVLSWSLTSDRKAMAYTVFEMMSQDLRDDIATLSTTALVLGAWEPSYPNKRDEQLNLYREQYKEATSLEITIATDARHFIMLDQPGWFYEQVDIFLGQKIHSN